MPSEYTTTVSLEPFYQRFLRANFKRNGEDQKEGEPFMFPLRDDFSMWLGRALNRCPSDYTPPNYGENEFRIVIPYNEYKNPASYNYISAKRQIPFRRLVHQYLFSLFHEQLKDLVERLHYTRSEAIDHLQEEFGFVPDDYDRLVKEYQRWLKKRRTERYKTRKQLKAEALMALKNKKKNVSSPDEISLSGTIGDA